MPHFAEIEGAAKRLNGGTTSWADITEKPAIATSGQLVLSVPAGSVDHFQVFSVAGMTTAMRVLLAIAPHSDVDENHESMIDVSSLSGETGNGQLIVRAGFSSQTSGPVRINYMVV